MAYGFYGWQNAAIQDELGLTPRDYYDLLSQIWSADTCAPRMRQSWSPENKTLGQCSITAFLLQDIYGGEVYGVPLGDGNYHCFNVVGDCVFDLTSEQFEKQKLNYVSCPKQERSIHFAKAEKKARYELLWGELMRRRNTIAMEAKSYELCQNTWRIEDMGVRFFLLTGTDRALLIDSGMTVNNAKEIAAGLTELPISLLNTHADRDHIGSNEQFESFYMHPAEEPVYLRSGKRGSIIPIQEGDTLDLGQRKLVIIELPGHTPGSIAVLDTENRVLISGDPIQEHGRIYMFGSHRNMDQYIRSLEHLEMYIPHFDEIWPSHADLPIPPDTIQKLHDGAKEILAGNVQGEPEELHGQNIVAYDLGFCTMLCDR